MKTEERSTKEKKETIEPVKNVSSSEKTKRKVSDSFFQRIISLLKKEELI
ncbi:hypothetical protein [Chryseobacterium piperi]|nr:hypothetical protein [Chryseobacterium piperi]